MHSLVLLAIIVGGLVGTVLLFAFVILPVVLCPSILESPATIAEQDPFKELCLAVSKFLILTY